MLWGKMGARTGRLFLLAQWERSCNVTTFGRQSSFYNRRPLIAMDLHVAQSWIEAEFHDHWTLSADELTLLPGETDKGRLRGRLGFAIQLKYMQLHGRFPERHEEIDPAAAQRLAYSNSRFRRALEHVRADQSPRAAPSADHSRVSRLSAGHRQRS